MARLKIDPWQPEYGAQAEIGISIEASAEPTVQVDATIESSDWSRARTPAPNLARPPFLFTDGVRRIDCRLVAEDRATRAFGLLGSFGVGSVRADANVATWHRARIERLVITGSGMLIDPVEVAIGAGAITFAPRSIADTDAIAPLEALQAAMRRAEADLAARLTEEGEGWVIADGPLFYPFRPDSRVVGVVKRLLAAYLTGEPAALLPRLEPGERSPIFALGHQALDRFAWYQRIAVRQGHWHELAGLVRCEVRMEMGLAAAAEMADVLAVHLPRFAGLAGHDPRAPQNLLPIGALEKRLRHLLGDPVLVRRRIEATIARRNMMESSLEAIGVGG